MPTYGFDVAAEEVKGVLVNRVRTSLLIVNASSDPLFLRDSGGISTLNSIRIPPRGFISFRIPEDDPTSAFFFITEGAIVSVRIMEQLGFEPLPVRVR